MTYSVSVLSVTSCSMSLFYCNRSQIAKRGDIGTTTKQTKDTKKFESPLFHVIFE